MRAVTALVELLKQDGVKLSGGGSEQECRCFYPQHDDKKPSMSVNVTKGVYHCQGCKRSGNAYTYLHEVRGLQPKECFDILEHQYGWDSERREWARSDTNRRTAERASKEDLEPAKWVEDIFPSMGGQPLDVVHNYYRADGSLAWCTARYKPPKGEDAIKGIPFTPAHSKGGGYWLKSPVGSKFLAIPEADRPFGEGDLYPVYGLMELLAAPKDRQVWIVEGEKCADAVNALPWTDDNGDQIIGPFPGISVRHGYRSADPANAYPMLDLEPLTGRECLVFADPDEGGHIMAKAIAKLLHLHYECEVRIVLPPIVKKGEPKIDIADVAAHGGLKAIGAWANGIGVKDYQPPASERPAKILPPMVETDQFKVLGLVGNDLAVRRKTTQQVLLLRTTAITQEGTLLRIATLGWWKDQCGNAPFSSTMRSSFGDALLRAGEAKGMINLSLDSAGRGAHDHDGVIRYNLGGKLLTTDRHRLLKNEVALDAVEFLYHPGPEIEMVDDPNAEQWGREFYEATAGYRWENADMHRSVMGWCVSALIGGCLPFRPHLWIIAPPTTGKTYLLNTMLGRLFGPLANRIVSGTEASVAGLSLSDSLPTLLDEFEAGEDRDGKAKWDRILELMRAATSGDAARTRSSAQTGAVSAIRPRFSAFVASVHRPDLNEANDSRFVTVRLSLRPVNDWPAVNRAIRAATDPSKMLAVRTRIIRHAALIRDKAQQIEEEMLMEDSTRKTRDAQIMSALIAGAWFLSGDEEPIMRDSMVKEDTWAPLTAMMGQIVRRPGLDDLTVAECLLRAYFSQGYFNDPDPGGTRASSDVEGPAAYRALCLRYGFKFVAAHELWVGPRAATFTDLMRSNKFSNIDWVGYLSGLPGCFRPRREDTGRVVQQRFGGVVHGVVAIGEEALRKVGFVR